jgi:hypothetical protein
MTAASTALPSFVVIGAQKSLTTALWEYLRVHPQIFCPEIKETNFFIEEGTWGRGLDWYRSLYAPAPVGTIHRGDVSPGYTMFPTFSGAPERIAGIVPDVKLVYILRDPVERMRSHYLHQLSVGFERRPMREALIRDYQYLSLSQYALQLDQYLPLFDREQLLVLRAEELAADPGPTLDVLLRFLDLEEGWRPPNLGTAYNVTKDRAVPGAVAYRVDLLLRRLQWHAAAARVRDVAGRSSRAYRPYSPAELEMDDDLRDRLRRTLAPDMFRLRALVAPDFDMWGFAEPLR